MELERIYPMLNEKTSVDIDENFQKLSDITNQLNDDTNKHKNNLASLNNNVSNVQKIIEDRGKEIISSEVVQNWLKENEFKPKDAVATFNDLPQDAELKELRGVTDENAVYVYDGTKWVKQSNLNFDGLSDIKSKVKVLYVNPSDFNAAGDGVTDDTLAVKNAARFAMDNQSTLLLRDKHLISDKIVVDKNLMIKGESDGTLILKSETPKNIVEVINGAKLRTEGVIYDETDYSGYATIEVNSGEIEAIGNKFLGNKFNGILIKDKVRGSKILNNYFENYYFCVCLKGTLDTTITGNTFTGGVSGAVTGGNGIKIQNDESLGWLNTSSEQAKRTVISNNIFRNLTEDGIDGYTGGENTLITNNVFESCGGMGAEIKVIYRDDPSTGGTSLENVRQPKNIQISGNIFKDMTGQITTLRLIQIEERSGKTLDVTKGNQNVIITNNVFENVYIALEISGVKDVQVSNNIFKRLIFRAITESSHCDSIRFVNNIIAMEGKTTSSAIVGLDNASNNNVIFSGNTITGHKIDTDYTTIGLLIAGKNLTIKDNTIINFKTGIQMNASSRVTIGGNVLDTCSVSGIILNSQVTELKIHDNSFYDCYRGINYGSSSSKNILESNNVFKGSTMVTSNETNPTGLTVANRTVFS